MSVTTAFQPIALLANRTVVGYQAPGELAQAVPAARRAGLGDGALLTVRTGGGVSGMIDDALTERARHFRIVCELNDRTLLASPRTLMRTVEALRDDGFAIALGGGAPRDSHALLHVIRPDIITFDLALVQRNPSTDDAMTLTAMLAYRERTETIVLATGIDTEKHYQQAVAVGAELGQGSLLGRPTRSPSPVTETSNWQSPQARRSPAAAGTPFDCVRHSRLIRVVRKETLVSLSETIERQAIAAADAPMVLTSLQNGRYFSGQTRRNYLELASSRPLVAVFGTDMPQPPPSSPLRLVDLPPSDPCSSEWVVLALGGHTATALVAREHSNNTGADGDREFDFTITHDRRAIAAVARMLLSRIP